MKTPETIFLIEQEGEYTFSATRPTSPTITDDQVTEYVKAEATKKSAARCGALEARRERIKYYRGKA